MVYAKTQKFSLQDRSTWLLLGKTQGTDGWDEHDTGNGKEGGRGIRVGNCFNPTVALPWDTPLPVASSTSTASLVLPSTVINVPDSDSDEDLTGYVSHSIWRILILQLPWWQYSMCCIHWYCIVLFLFSICNMNVFFFKILHFFCMALLRDVHVYL